MIEIAVAMFDAKSEVAGKVVSLLSFASVMPCEHTGRPISAFHLFYPAFPATHHACAISTA